MCFSNHSPGYLEDHRSAGTGNRGGRRGSNDFRGGTLPGQIADRGDGTDTGDGIAGAEIGAEIQRNGELFKRTFVDSHQFSVFSSQSLTTDD